MESDKNYRSFFESLFNLWRTQHIHVKIKIKNSFFALIQEKIYMMNVDISVVIPNFNGDYLLKGIINNILELKDTSELKIEIIVVDDGSSDDSLNILDKFSKDIVLLSTETNQGFPHAINHGVFHASGDYLFLLNTDVFVNQRVLETLFYYADSHSDIFAISPAILSETGTIYSPHAIFPEWKDGFLRLNKHESPDTIDNYVKTFFVSAGSGLFHREKFLSLSCLNGLLSPFYSEDVEICWKAWSRGWPSYFFGQAKVIHRRNGVINRYFKKSYVEKIKIRNRIISGWLHATMGELIFNHFFSLPLILRKKYGPHKVASAYIDVLTLLPKIIKERLVWNPKRSLNDISREIKTSWRI
jgi:GT2 family glycosyltransferase